MRCSVLNRNYEVALTPDGKFYLAKVHNSPYPWEVRDEEGNAVNSFENHDEAVAYAHRLARV